MEIWFLDLLQRLEHFVLLSFPLGVNLGQPVNDLARTPPLRKTSKGDRRNNYPFEVIINLTFLNTYTISAPQPRGERVRAHVRTYTLTL